MSVDLDHPEENELDTHALRRHDFVVAIIVWLIALLTAIESWHLTFDLELPGVAAEKAWLVSPGIFPLLLSVGLLLMFSVILVVSYQEGKFRGYFSNQNILKFITNSDNVQQFAQITLLCLYVFGMLGRINFGLASGIYLFAVMFAARAARWYVILLIAIVFPIFVTYVFGTLMKIPLP